MKALHTICVLFIVLSSQSADAQFMFRRTYGLGNTNVCNYAIQALDHGYVVCGTTTPFTGGQTDFYLLRTDSAGLPVYQYNYGGSGIDNATTLLQLPDSNLLIAGFSNGYNLSNDYDACILKTDFNGNLQWVKPLGTSDWDFIYDMHQSPDGNLILVGNSYGSGNGRSSGLLLKTDPDANVIWQKFLELPQHVFLKQLAIRADGSFFVVGNISGSVSYPTDGYVALLDSNGDLIRSKVYDIGTLETINAIDFFSNGDLALAGNAIDSMNNFKNDLLFLRMDTNLNVLWNIQSIQTGSDIYNDIVVYSDTFVIAGSTTTFAQGRNDFHLLLYDGNGAYIRGNTYGANENDLCNHVLFTNDGGFLLAGNSTSYGPSHQSIFLVKSDSILTFDPNVTINVSQTNLTESLAIGPIPASTNIKINSHLSGSHFSATLITLEGRVIRKIDGLNFPATIDVSDLVNGIYFLELKNNEFSFTKKLIVNR